MSDTAPVTAPAAVEAPTAPATPDARIESSRNEILQRITQRIAPEPEKAAAGPPEDEQRADRLARLVAADNRARAERDRLRVDNEAIARERAELAAERERVGSDHKRFADASEALSKNDLVRALSLLKNGEISTEDLISLINGAASEEQSDPAAVARAETARVLREERERIEAENAVERAKIEDLQAKKRAEEESGFQRAAGAYAQEIISAWSPEKRPLLERFVDFDEKKMEARALKYVNAGKEIPPASVMLDEWEAELVASLPPQYGVPARQFVESPRFSTTPIAGTHTPQPPRPLATAAERLEASRAEVMAKLRAMGMR